VSASLECGRLLGKQGHGALVVLSSVAAERTRRSLFAYASSKAGIDSFALGLADALRPQGVHVLVARPGFVHTKLTAPLKAPPFATTPDAVARVVDAGLERGARIVWAPPLMRWVMAVLRHLPHAVFSRLPV
jgi:decaprenylphospho-beta-D-erythro-pentofuranosid-2-ulose 2-reductase